MARPVGEPAWPPSEHHGERLSLRRWIGPAVLLLISGSAVLLLGGGLLGNWGPLSAGGPRAAPSGSPTSSPRLDSEGSPSTGGPSTAGPSTAGPSAQPSTTTGEDLRSPSPSPTLTQPGGPTVSPLPGATSGPTPSPGPSRPPGAAPASAAEFDFEGQVIEIGFPLKEGVRWRYRDNWWDRRDGTPEHYNHVRGRRQGELVRAHDGIDVYVRLGTPVIAPFAGLVIDPATRWQPWHDDRHGGQVTIVSQEPLSEGYAATLSHLDQVFVEPGDVVRRGEVIGLAGNTGNAEGGPVHLHFELRAPFLLEWLEAGETRTIDAFNPYPSLVAADPSRPAGDD